MNFHPLNTRVQGPMRRFPELLDGLKAEYDTLLRDTNVFAMQRDEYEKQLEYHRVEAQRIQDQLFELEHYHKDIVNRCQEEIEYLKRQLDMQGQDNHNHDGAHKYDTKQRTMLHGIGPGPSRLISFSPNLSVNDSNRAPSSLGLPAVLSSLKTDQNSVITGVVASVVGGRPGLGGPAGGAGKGALPGTRGILPGTSSRASGTQRPASSHMAGNGAAEGGEEYSNLVIEEQDIVMASVNTGEK